MEKKFEIVCGACKKPFGRTKFGEFTSCVCSNNTGTLVFREVNYLLEPCQRFMDEWFGDYAYDWGCS